MWSSDAIFYGVLVLSVFGSVFKHSSHTKIDQIKANQEEKLLQSVNVMYNYVSLSQCATTE